MKAQKVEEKKKAEIKRLKQEEEKKEEAKI